MDTHHLQLFVAVADEGSIHGGARRLMIAQPAASRALRALERQLSTELLTRSTAGVELTAAGEALYDEATRIIRALDQTTRIVQSAAAGERNLTVGLLAGVAAASEITRDIIQGYRRQLPDVHVVVRELDFDNQFRALETGEIDVAILRTPCVAERVRTTALFDEPLVLAMRSDHELSDRLTLATTDVLDETMLDMPGTPSDWRGYWQLNDVRRGSPRTGPSVRTLGELQMSLATEPDLVVAMTLTAWRLSQGQSELHAARLSDAPSSTAVAVVRENETRDFVVAFVEHAQCVAAHSLAKVPEATLPS